MNSPARLVAEFHRLVNRARRRQPAPSIELLRESTVGALVALRDGTPERVAKELADVVYVAYGLADDRGIDLDAAIAAVHRANMTRLERCRVCDGMGFTRDAYGRALECVSCESTGVNPRFREDGKVITGPGYRPPDLKGTVSASTPDHAA